jgi:adenylosuccinate lyase
VLAALKRRAFEHKLTPTVGRSHGIHAEPTTFGLKLAGLCRVQRASERLVAAREEIATCAISGAVGTFANIDPRRGACRREAGPGGRAGLDAGDPARPPRHVFRDARRRRLLDRAAGTEIRHLQRTEVLEAEEYFSPGQKGSSAMPHKRNPVLTENLTGLARMVRGYVTPALENVALWHERDISHSSVERYDRPRRHRDARLRAGAPDRRRRQAAGLSRADAEESRPLGGLVHSQRVLLALTQAGAQPRGRLQAGAAQRDEGLGTEVTAFLPPDRLEASFDLAFHLKHVDTIFERVFGA